MKLLLDTPIWLWSLLSPERLTRKVSQALEDPASELWVSPFTTWEALVLAQKGRIDLKPDPVRWIDQVFKTVPFLEAPFNHRVAIQSRLLVFRHQDPVDRFLGATAMVYGLVLVTADRHLLKMKNISLLPNK